SCNSLTAVYLSAACFETQQQKNVRRPLPETLRQYPLEGLPLPFQETAFDGVILDGALEQQNIKPAKLLRELKRLLKPGGWLFVKFPNRWSRDAIVGALRARRRHTNSLSLRQCTGLLKKLGL